MLLARKLAQTSDLGFNVTNLTLSSRAVVRFYNRRSLRPCSRFYWQP
jgi:hypothetical protein